MSLKGGARPPFDVYCILYACIVVCLSCAFFFVVTFLFTKLYSCKYWIVDLAFKPGSPNYSEEKWRKLLNLSVSLVHSCVSGPAAVYAMFLYPEMMANIISSYNDFTRNLMLFVIGYFIYDSIDNMTRHRATYWILVHHMVMVFTFAISAFPGLYLGYGAAGLFMEINSIFLHLRMLLKMHGVDKETLAFRVICWINIGTFVLFRIVVMAWMTRWLFAEGSKMYAFHLNVTRFGIIIMALANGVLFYQVLAADGYIGGRKVINVD